MLIYVLRDDAIVDEIRLDDPRLRWIDSYNRIMEGSGYTAIIPAHERRGERDPDERECRSQSH